FRSSNDGTVALIKTGDNYDLSGFDGDWSSLLNVPANLDLDATDDFDGEWTSLQNVPADFADGVDNVDDADSDPLNEIQEITSNDGTVALTKTGNNYDLSGFDGEWTSLLNVPANLDLDATDEIGRASCRERNELAEVADGVDNEDDADSYRMN